MDDKNTRVRGERTSGRREETTRAHVSAEPVAHAQPSSSASRAATRPAQTRSTSSPSAAGTSTAFPIGGAADPGEPRTAELEAEIAQTRGELSETVNAIQERLQPRHVAAQAKEAVKHAALDRTRQVAESEPIRYARSNPLPLAMIGIGLAGCAMLAFGDRDTSRVRYRRRETVRGWRSRPQEDRTFDGLPPGYDDDQGTDVYTTGLTAGRYRAEDERDFGIDPRASAPGHEEWGSPRAAAIVERSREMLHRRENQLHRTWDENPLVIGAATAVLGALAGLALPQSARENQLMGEARDSMVESVQSTVKDKVNQVQQAATDAVNTVKETASTVAGLSGGKDDAPNA